MKCKKDLGKEWGHLPTENDPITSGPAYVISQLIEMYIKEQVCVFADKSKKDAIIQGTVKDLFEHQKSKGPFKEELVHSKLLDRCLMSGMHPSQRTLQDYGIPIIRGLCIKTPRDEYVLDLTRLQNLSVHTQSYKDIMFG